MIEDGDLVLDDISVLLARYVAFPSPECLVAVVLWIVHTHAVDCFESTPRLAALSPEKGSGKTRTLEVLALLVPNPLHAVNITAAALYRSVAPKQPTLLLDEADTYLGITVAKQHEELRGLINAGHRRGATVYRGEVSGKKVNVVEFPAYRRLRVRRHRRPARHHPRPVGDRADETTGTGRARRAVPRTTRPDDAETAAGPDRDMGRTARSTSSATPGPTCPTASPTGPPTSGNH